MGFVAYTQLTGSVDAFGRVLYYTALFLGLLLASNALRFLRLPFFISAWAYSFPLAALTVATLVMSVHLGAFGLSVLGAVLLALLSLVVAILTMRTVMAVVRGEIFQPG